MRVGRAAICAVLALAPAASVAELPALQAPRTGRQAPNDAAVVVGVEKYVLGLTPATYAERDADAFADFLRDTVGVPRSRVRVLKGPLATKGAIEREVAEQARAVGPGGTLWIYFSGHGAPAPDGDAFLFGVTANPLPAYLDEGAVRRRELQRLAGTVRADARAIVLLDACFSGKTRGGDALMDVRFAAPASILAAPRVAVWTAASGTEYAGPLEAARHGLFTYFAVGALAGWADADGNGAVDLREAERYVRDRMSLALEQAGRRQEPELAAPDDADRWVLATLGSGAARGPEDAALRQALFPMPSATAAPAAAAVVEPPKTAPAAVAEPPKAAAEPSKTAPAAVAAPVAEPPKAASVAATSAVADPPARAAIDWVTLKGGSYVMGDEGSWDRPATRVKVGAFQMARTEVTVAQYRACVTAGACAVPSGRWVGCNYGVAGRDDHPVNCVGLDQARAYAAWVGGRLPSEAEWEYAARGGGADIEFPWGNEKATCDRAIVEDANKVDGCGLDRSWPVCSKPAGNSKHGLCDMAGNVQEWTEDCFDPDVAWPKDGRPKRSADCDTHILRGGSWQMFPYVVHTRGQSVSKPTEDRENNGIRPVRAVP
jgi:formylglycine-generating enzyme required for sulfatase activity